MAEEKKDQLDEKEVTREELDEKQALEATEQMDSADEKPMEIKKQSKLKAFLSTKKGKVIATLLILAVVLGVIFGVPTTRYGTLGYFVKKDVRVSVIDASTKKPVSDAMVKLDGQSIKTSAKGEATLKNIPVGEYEVTITKKYYKDASSSYIVPVLSSPKQVTTNLQATGRQVEVRVSNLVTKAALAKASIAVGGTSAITDDKGVAVVVLPADKKTLPATVSLVGYNDKKVNITITEQTDKNNITLTPEGKLLYLSNQSGTMDVVKSNLDGSEAAVVVKGTGNENVAGSALLASRDWKYAVLITHRTDDTDVQMYIIDTHTGELSLVDKGSGVNFNMLGWSNHRFVYVVDRYNKQNWESGHQSLKSYDSDTDKLATIDDTSASGSTVFDYKYEQISGAYLIRDKVIYGKSWYSGAWYGVSEPMGKKSAIMSINVDGSQKQSLKEFPANVKVVIDARRTGVEVVDFMVKVDESQPTFYAYRNGTLTPTTISSAKFYTTHEMSYLISPSGSKTFWSEFRDGRSTLFVGDGAGGNARTIAALSDFLPYGWFSNEYLLLTNRNELYIAPANKPLTNAIQPIKIANYYG